MEAATAARQEAEARLAHLEEKARGTAPGGVSHANIAAIAKVIRRNVKNGGV